MKALIPLTWDIVVRGVSEIGKLLVVVALGVVALEVLAYVILHRLLRYRYALPLMLLLPALVGVAALIVYPFGFNVYLALSNMNMYRFKEFSVGLSHGITNLLDVFRLPVLQKVTFLQLLARTVLWTAVNVVCHVLGGLGLAILLNRPMRGKGIYRTLL
ncbi:MAG: sugar ABC transporter permease, partial [Bacillota bacterium]